MRRTAEGRSELVELADDSASSADATIPSSPRGAGSMTGRRSVPLCLERGEAVDMRTGMRKCKTPERTLSTRAHRRRPRRHRTAPRDQKRSRQSAARPPRSTGHAGHGDTCPKRKKENPGRLNERVTEKIKARAWRNKSKRNVKARDGEKIKTKPRR